MSTDLPAYVLDSSPLAVFTRLQRVGLHLEALQGEALRMLEPLKHGDALPVSGVMATTGECAQ